MAFYDENSGFRNPFPRWKNFRYPCDLLHSEIKKINRYVRFSTKSRAKRKHWEFIASWVLSRAKIIAGAVGVRASSFDCFAPAFLIAPFISDVSPFFVNKFFLCDATIFSTLTFLRKSDFPDEVKETILEEMQFYFHQAYGISKKASKFLWKNRQEVFAEICTEFPDDIEENCFTLIQFSLSYDALLKFYLTDGHFRIFKQRDDVETAQPLPLRLMDYYELIIYRAAYTQLLESYDDAVKIFGQSFPI